jgi:hypothetical protein
LRQLTKIKQNREAYRNEPHFRDHPASSYGTAIENSPTVLIKSKGGLLITV